MRNEEQNNKPVTGYPYPTPAAQSSNSGYPYTAPPPANYYTSNPYAPSLHNPTRRAFPARIDNIRLNLHNLWCIKFNTMASSPPPYTGISNKFRYRFAIQCLDIFLTRTLNETKFGAKFASSDAYVGDFFSKKMDRERKSGTVNFNVRLKGLVKFRSSTWRTRVHLLSVLCEGVSIGFTSNSGLGTLAGGPKKCDVKLYLGRNGLDVLVIMPDYICWKMV
ncbi:hypothetical protein IFM89_018874 [Coptis chinensis]|uniref:Uncharacterized protein n=1 Tax=Coptis chinensis TaxID=261450 RepID=A0A835LJ22_9MAGN|nr:hypothetical protein IFM89_018874 [Coptis chinensis]